MTTQYLTAKETFFVAILRKLSQGEIQFDTKEYAKYGDLVDMIPDPNFVRAEGQRGPARKIPVVSAAGRIFLNQIDRGVSFDEARKTVAEYTALGEWSVMILPTIRDGHSMTSALAYVNSIRSAVDGGASLSAALTAAGAKALADAEFDAAAPNVASPAEPVAEAPAEPVAEAPAEPVAEAPAEPVAEAPAEPVAEAPAEPAKVTRTGRKNKEKEAA